jgi:hypothetical protein
LGQSEIKPRGSIAVAPLEKAVGGEGGGVLIAEGELVVVVVVKAAVHRVCVLGQKHENERRGLGFRERRAGGIRF